MKVEQLGFLGLAPEGSCGPPPLPGEFEESLTLSLAAPPGFPGIAVEIPEGAFPIQPNADGTEPDLPQDAQLEEESLDEDATAMLAAIIPPFVSPTFFPAPALASTAAISVVPFAGEAIGVAGPRTGVPVEVTSPGLFPSPDGTMPAFLLETGFVATEKSAKPAMPLGSVMASAPKPEFFVSEPPLPQLGTPIANLTQPTPGSPEIDPRPSTVTVEGLVKSGNGELVLDEAISAALNLTKVAREAVPTPITRSDAPTAQNIEIADIKDPILAQAQVFPTVAPTQAELNEIASVFTDANLEAVNAIESEFSVLDTDMPTVEEEAFDFTKAKPQLAITGYEADATQSSLSSAIPETQLSIDLPEIEESRLKGSGLREAQLSNNDSLQSELTQSAAQGPIDEPATETPVEVKTSDVEGNKEDWEPAAKPRFAAANEVKPSLVSEILSHESTAPSEELDALSKAEPKAVQTESIPALNQELKAQNTESRPAAKTEAGDPKIILGQLQDRIERLREIIPPMRTVIHLDPAELGPITLSIQRGSQGNEATISSNNQQVLQALEANRKDLMQVVQSKGVDLSSLNLQQDAHGQAQQQATHQDFQRTINMTQALANPLAAAEVPDLSPIALSTHLDIKL